MYENIINCYLILLSELLKVISLYNELEVYIFVNL
uniref:Uncharacterized protein n=1 Tax=Corynecladia elata TaxID=3101723 RepID=A0AA51REA4_9FLOR|nr:hypothetical protein RU988_pgp145 [Laurencia elata]WMP12649.1 hypothetical protein [Laurencia elata]